MSKKINQDFTQREFEIETAINSVYKKSFTHYDNSFEVEEHMCEQIYKAHKKLVKIEEIIKSLRAQLRDADFVNDFIYEKLEIQTFRKEKLIQDTRKLFDKLSPDMFFQYLKDIYENTKSAAGTGTMSSFFEKLESESA
jgi:hypothetical protein